MFSKQMIIDPKKLFDFSNFVESLKKFMFSKFEKTVLFNKNGSQIKLVRGFQKLIEFSKKIQVSKKCSKF